MPPPIKSMTKPISSSEAEGPASNNLWIGNLSHEVTDSDLMALFEKYGPVDSITNYSARSYGFVYYKKIEDAKSAKEKLQGTILHGNPIKIEFAKPVCVLLISSNHHQNNHNNCWISYLINFFNFLFGCKFC